ncbi:HD domain-containing phosphohydrolase [Natranaerofaba carboxydovora]|uniref:HD domain-containing phosphohydrolase n=1 Tax=Natranaerofaba carboxydovora TaxID=2742683 RepID=UPI001F1389F6|nr:HD domain-containing phosphohydrolase [Natranaerofaba carboxydovora]UMZ72672.1 3'3'-cGAMP-specific phosphodiesterase 2 [Natranaerofaba carboxydovora]
MDGLYSQLAEEFSFINYKAFRKSSMLAVSHAIEDLILSLSIDAEMFVTFQKFEFFEEEYDKYLELDKFGKNIFIFAKDIDRTKLDKFKNTTFVEIDDSDELIKEWDIIVNHPEYPITFSSYEVSVMDKPERTFLGFLSFYPAVTAKAVKHFSNELKKKDIYYYPETDKYEPLSDREKRFGNILEKFINNTLDEIELKDTIREQGQSIELIKRLCYAAEYRDIETALHLVKISKYMTWFYDKLDIDISSSDSNSIGVASLVHDIGKIGIPDNILLKPGRLTGKEYEIMKNHTNIGASILKDPYTNMLKTAKDIALYHHERWDGQGYPTGKKKEEIPLTARMAAIVDVFDALSSKRVYKDSYSVNKCIDIMKEERNMHFDGEMLDIFLANLNELIELKNELEEKSKLYSEEDMLEEIIKKY